MRRFAEMMEVHEGLDAALAEHQLALAGLELEQAAEALARYDALIRDHMRIEEGWILPLYETRVPAAADAVLYRGEHRRIRMLLDEFAERLARARALQGERERRGAVIALFDRESVLKNLLEHHDARERNVLYPALDRACPPEESERVFELIDRGEPLPAEGPLAARPPEERADARRIVGAAVGLFVTAVRLADDTVGLAPTPPATAIADDAAVPDPEVILGRDALELAGAREASDPLLAALASAANDALTARRRALAPERLMTMVTRGARLPHLTRALAGS